MRKDLTGRALEGLLILAPALMLLVLLARPIQDVDIFWQLRLGELALDRGALVNSEPFAARHIGEPLSALGWLAQIVLALVRRAGGWSALQVFDGLVWILGLVAAAGAARRFAAPGGVLAALVLAFAAALPSASLRPQSFAVLGFGLMIALLASPGRWRVRLVLGTVLLLLWQNLHPSVAVAVVYLSARAAWMWFERGFMRRAGDLPWLETCLAAVAGLAIFATPSGAGILAVTARNAATSEMMAVTEWHPIWSAVNSELTGLLLPVPAIFLLLVAIQIRRVDLTWLVPSIVLLVASALAVRFSLFWALSSICVLAPLFTDGQGEERGFAPRQWLSLGLLSVAAMLALLIHQPRFSPEIPLKAIAALKRTDVRGTVYAEFPWGGPVIDIGYPDWRVALDGRYYVYTDYELGLARTVGTAGDGLAWIDRHWHPVAMLISPRFSPALHSLLRSDPANWREIYSDQSSAAFVRITARASSAAPAASRSTASPAGQASGP